MRNTLAIHDHELENLNWYEQNFSQAVPLKSYQWPAQYPQRNFRGWVFFFCQCTSECNWTW